MVMIRLLLKVLSPGVAMTKTVRFTNSLESMMMMTVMVLMMIMMVMAALHQRRRQIKVAPTLLHRDYNHYDDGYSCIIVIHG